VQKLGGRISVESKPEFGTVFRIHLPVTLATLRAVIVRTGGQRFAVPVRQIDRVVAADPRDVRMVEGRETISLDQRVVPLVGMDAALHLAPAADSTRDGRRISVLVLGIANERVAYRVDEIGAEQEILVKPLGLPLFRVRNIAGATILADGKAVPLLHVPDLLKTAATLSLASMSLQAAPKRGAGDQKVRVLVAEDSITSRMLLKNILEIAGYPVTTAVDGADALATLRTGGFGLVVSDVDMPRMDGFDLTAAIRSDQRIANLPIVLVTARETREDRERGIDAGANAYIVKSSFDQRNLLEVIGRLV
jgi:two-component system chemotaxis sensor kinase CheA